MEESTVTPSSVAPTDDAAAIYQGNLDVISDAALRGDFAAARPRLALPFHMRTLQGWFPINTEAELEEGVMSLHRHLKAEGVTDYVRTCRAADFINDTTIEGIHTTRALAGSQLTKPVYYSRQRMALIDGIWRVTQATHTLSNEAWPVSNFNPAEGGLEALNGQTEIDAYALTIYAEFITKLTVIDNAQDFEARLALSALPQSVHIDRTEHQINTRHDLLAYLNKLKNMFDNRPDCVLRRAPETAGFVDSHTIRGYHLSHVEGSSHAARPDPVRTRMTIRLFDDGWRLIDISHSIKDTAFPFTDPVFPDEPVSELRNPKDTKHD